jgi:SRSO17 transposase
VVLIVDETGDLKKGHCHGGHPAPVHRDRRADRERACCRLPGLRCPAGCAFIDRALYLPRSWTSDTAFATKPALAKAMIAH